jgi:disulfide bond formation protein DsbB
MASILLVGVLLAPRGRDALRRIVGGQERPLLLLAWLVAVVATGGSLYFSEIVGFQPCLLCWYQRIAMYPLVLVLGVAVFARDARVWRYGLPLSLSGVIISTYHVLLQNRPTLVPAICDAAASCTVRYVAEFGFVSIPVMAGSGFLLISALLLAVRIGAPPRESA